MGSLRNTSSMFANVNEKQSHIPSEVLGKVLNLHFEETFTIPVRAVVFA